MTLEADILFRHFDEPLSNLRRVGFMARLASVVCYSAVSRVRALQRCVLRVFHRIRWLLVRRPRPARSLVAGDARPRRLVQFHQELALGGIAELAVRLVTRGALNLALLQLYWVARRRRLDFRIRP